MERKWNANGTHLRTRSGRVPNAFSVRLFLSSTVVEKTLIQTLASQLLLSFHHNMIVDNTYMQTLFSKLSSTLF